MSTVLIVDDERLGRETLEAVLYAAGYQLLFAASGEEALRLAASHIPDIILLDVMMPGMDGYTVCRRLRSDPELALIPLILVTALDDRESRLRGIEAGADDFITKPYDHAEVRLRVRTITRLNRSRRLLAAEQRFAWVVEHAQDGYLTIDAADAIRYANPRARRLLGLPDSGPLGMVQFKEQALRQYQCEPAPAWDCWPQAEDAAFPRYLIIPETAGTAAFWLQVELRIPPAGHGEERIIQLRDVSAQLGLQRDITSFHGTVAHKLRTPLVSTITSLALLDQQAEVLEAAETRQLIRIARQGATRLHDSVEQVLQFANASFLAKPGEPLSVRQVTAVIDQTCARLAIAPAAISVQAGLDHEVLGISQRAVELIISELLENSKKFHRQQTPQIDVTITQASAQQLCVQVRDDATPPAVQHLGRVWNPYFQSEPVFTGEVRGMGLGLSLVAHLVWSAGGSYRIAARTDRRGVSVELLLPVIPHAEEAAASQPAAHQVILSSL